MARVTGIALVLVGVAFVPWGILKLVPISRGISRVRLFTVQLTNPSGYIFGVSFLDDLDLL